jgi:hypothetical protein
MPESIAQHLSESRLRRWWRTVHSAIESMEMSGYEHLAVRIGDLENRVRYLEAARDPDNRATMPTPR